MPPVPCSKRRVRRRREHDDRSADVDETRRRDAHRGNLVAALEGAIRDTLAISPELSTTGGTSDGRFIADICPQVVEFGPINASIHKVNEHVAVADLEPLAAIYQETLTRLLKP